ncbi:DUF6228 family protein [Streptomyces mirabilis]
MTSAECPVRLRLKIIEPALTPTWTRFSSASRKPSAVFRSGGHVGLTWTLRPWPRAAGGWSASATTWLEAGEQMTALAADLRHFLAGEPR